MLTYVSSNKHTVNQHHIPLPHPFLPQYPSQRLHLLQNPRITKLLFIPSDRTIPHNRDCIPMTGMNMSINAIVTVRDLTTREPRPRMSLRTIVQAPGRCVKSAIRLGVPVKLGRMVHPESF